MRQHYLKGFDIRTPNNCPDSVSSRCSYEQAAAQVEQLLKKFIRPETISSEGSIDFRLGDFRELARTLPDDSVDLILTDPPYGRQFHHLWDDLAREAARVLKPGAFFVSYTGQHRLPEILRALANHLEYFWMGFLMHRTRPRRDEVCVVNAAKPLPIFYKPPRRMPARWFTDAVMGSGPEKQLHPWQQAAGEARHLITTFSRPGDLVLDPFAGAATTLVAACDEGRRSIGFEVERKTYDVANRRLARRTGRLRLIA